MGQLMKIITLVTERIPHLFAAATATIKIVRRPKKRENK
jgi:hypothetical protein